MHHTLYNSTNLVVDLQIASDEENAESASGRVKAVRLCGRLRSVVPVGRWSLAVCGTSPD